MCAAAIKRGNKANRFGRLRVWLRHRRREVSHDAFEIMRTDGDVRVVDDEVFVAGLRRELGEGADLSVGAEAQRTLDEADGAVGEFALQLLHGAYCGVIER